MGVKVASGKPETLANTSTGQKIEVRVRVNVTRLIDVDTSQSKIHAALVLEASWVDKELKGFRDVDQEKSNQLSGKLFVKESPDRHFFAPRLELTNLLDSEKDEWFQIYDDKPDDPDHVPVVCYRLRITGVFQVEVDLSRFPFDTQTLSMRLVAFWAVGEDKDVILTRNLSRKYRSLCNTDTFSKREEYELFPHVGFRESRTKPENSMTRSVYPILFIDIYVERNLGYWAINVALPLFVLSNSTFTSFAIEPNEFANRAATILTILLTMVAFKYAIADKLPRISYLTTLDIYMLSSFFFCFGALIFQFSECTSDKLYHGARSSGHRIHRRSGMERTVVPRCCRFYVLPKSILSHISCKQGLCVDWSTTKWDESNRSFAMDGKRIRNYNSNPQRLGCIRSSQDM
mmetsp:Transcript_6547/g.11533  ORF Transcript_6547/g.11533 Transcript_6547/m.11533 type:complete len:403 (-) Transcript_6547:542-1750(-)